MYVTTLKCFLCYFLEILDYIYEDSLVPSWVTFDSFSSLAPSIDMPGPHGREGGSAGLRLHPPASMAPDPQRHSGEPH